MKRRTQPRCSGQVRKIRSIICTQIFELVKYFESINDYRPSKDLHLHTLPGEDVSPWPDLQFIITQLYHSVLRFTQGAVSQLVPSAQQQSEGQQTETNNVQHEATTRVSKIKKGDDD